MRTIAIYVATLVFLISELVGLMNEVPIVPLLLKSVMLFAVFLALGMLLAAAVEHTRSETEETPATEIPEAGTAAPAATDAPATPAASAENAVKEPVSESIKKNPKAAAETINTLISQ